MRGGAQDMPIRRKKWCNLVNISWITPRIPLPTQFPKLSSSPTFSPPLSITAFQYYPTLLFPYATHKKSLL